MRNYTIANPLARALFATTQQEVTTDGAAMLESNLPQEPQPRDMETAMFEAVAARAAGDMRSLAASMLAQWVDDGDQEADSFDALAISMAGLDGMDDDTDFTDEQIDDYNDALAALADAAVSLGADQDDVTEMIDDYDDAAAERVYDALSGDDADMMEEAIALYTVAGGDSAMLEAVRKKVVRDGKVKVIRKRPRPRRLNSLQKQALKKARRKAHTSVAKMHRRKSMQLRKKRGL
ncbi:hypothetical protein RZQ20_22100 [Raoultella ornithinolytica]|uniref:hypothetical protein n=1 Tax=Raoultella ornithinolytica TaxID=54291 RepID=UPI00292C7CA4|nr:hypothetical protein [Raoultella ornithinolytica]MDV1094960.1 hypothetical protein [Raoultella ornithinolytica]MDV1122696.1 hypothetical protein [Raoultella ornithinolytica]MDV1893211.1 hypothetical protein [Raoultella ornithinolytica]